MFLSLIGVTLKLTDTPAPNGRDYILPNDVVGGHPDFETYMGEEKEMVTTTLGVDHKPVCNTAKAAAKRQSCESFAQWFQTVEGVNKEVPLDIILNWETSNGYYQYDSNSFFPLTDDARGYNNKYDKNTQEGCTSVSSTCFSYHFTLECASIFVYRGQEILSFRGDDDLWIYINRQRVIDLGGVHGAQEAEVSLDNLGLTLGTAYELHTFFAERHRTDSNFRLTTTFGTTCGAEHGDVQTSDCLVNCVGSWGAFGSCDAASGRESHTYTVTTAAKNGGTECPAANGSTQSQECGVNCVGSWGTYNACNTGTGEQSRRYAVTTPAGEGGADCPAADGAVGSRVCLVRCVGSWSSFSACDAETGERARSYSITVTAKNGGGVCPAVGGEVSVESCPVDCYGRWSTPDACEASTGLKTRVYTVQQTAKNGGRGICPV